MSRSPAVMARARALLLVVCLTLGFAATAATPAQAAPVTVGVGTQFTDTTGALVHAHGGGMIKVGSYYYWFGEDRHADGTFQYISAWRSTDLKNWEFRSHALSQSSAAELTSANIERPKVIYNASTGQYVMWMHKENGTDYSEARAAVAVSSSVEGPYTYLGSFRPLDTHMSRDITTFVDSDGSAYMVSAAANNANLNVYRLTADYTGVASLVQVLWAGSYREAPALFKRGSVYFLLTSGATGWAPNQQRYATASSIAGAWTSLTDVGDSTTFGSQTAYVLPVQGTSTTSYLYLGDRWAGTWGGPVIDSRYVWLPLTFPTSTSMTMAYAGTLTIDAATGTVSANGSGWDRLTLRHSGKCLDVRGQSTANSAAITQYTCNGGTNQQWRVQSISGGYYQIVARNSEKCLDVNSASTADGATLIQYTCGSGTNQQWSLVDSGDGYISLKARHSGKCADVPSSSTAENVQLKQYPCNGGYNQQFSRTAL